MLKKWRLAGFKSVLSLEEFELKPLTLFTGANSAGKSTVLQSMLLTAQTIQSPSANRAVVLNGNMVKMGSYSDIVSFGFPETSIRIGFDLCPLLDFGGGELEGASHAVDAVFSVDYEFSVDSERHGRDSNLLDLQPGLDRVDLRMFDGVSTTRFVVEKSHEPISKIAEHLDLNSPNLERKNLESLEYSVVVEGLEGSPYRDNIFSSWRVNKNGRNRLGEYCGAILDHFIPTHLSFKYDEVKLDVDQKLSIVFGNFYRSRAPAFFQEFIVDESVAKYISSLFTPLIADGGVGGSLSAQGSTKLRIACKDIENKCDLIILNKLYMGLSPRDRAILVFHAEEKRSEIEKRLREKRASKNSLKMESFDEVAPNLSGEVRDFFKRRVKYLGPLRDEPKPIYPFSGLSDPLDVGFKGEYTAAVFHLNKDVEINYFPASYFSDGAGGARWGSLESAVQDWLEYMGVGSGISTSDLGKLGHEIKLSAGSNNQRHDLTQVGVGVSQLLPILVMSLLSDNGACMIFEQPELHLHPKVQTRLADFFVSMTMLGKQCVVETHSEYLINRVRYRAVADDGSNVAESTALFFVTKEGDQSNYRRVVIDQLGGLDVWPSGFFDEGELEARALLKQVVAKRRKIKGAS